MKNDKQTAAEKIQNLLMDKEVKKHVPQKLTKPENEKLKRTPYGQKPNPKAKGGGSYIPKGVGFGKRNGSGRKTGGTFQQKRLNKRSINEHYNEEVDVKVKDPLNGKEKIIKKPRILVQLERLYRASTRPDGSFDVSAIDKWLNRALGKAPQPLIGDEEEDPIKVDLGIERILGKAYGRDKDE